MCMPQFQLKQKVIQDMTTMMPTTMISMTMQVIWITSTLTTIYYIRYFKLKIFPWAATWRNCVFLLFELERKHNSQGFNIMKFKKQEKLRLKCQSIRSSAVALFWYLPLYPQENQITNVNNLPNGIILEQNAGRSVAEMVSDEHLLFFFWWLEVIISHRAK